MSCKRLDGTFLSTGRGSAENFCLEVTPAAISSSMRSNTPFMTMTPKLVTMWP